MTVGEDNPESLALLGMSANTSAPAFESDLGPVVSQTSFAALDKSLLTEPHNFYM